MLIFVLPIVVVLFVVGITLAALGSRVKHPIAIAVNFLLIGCLFFLLNAGGIEPGVVGGNGNPGIILWIPLLVLACVLLAQLYVVSWLRRLGPGPLAAILLGLIAHQAAGFEIQRIRYRELRERTMGVIMEPDSEAGRRTAEIWLSGIDSIHMGSHFFHLNTYLLFVGWIIMAAVVLSLVKILRNRRAKKEET